MSKGDFADICQLYDRTAVWLRDCARKGDLENVSKAQTKMEELDFQLSFEFGENRLEEFDTRLTLDCGKERPGGEKA
ncbi:MAG: hypothetical protein ABSD42_04495 [Candidatus Bathyarchaeia archaeon]|jgi:hypothetical protein